MWLWSVLFISSLVFSLDTGENDLAKPYQSLTEVYTTQNNDNEIIRIFETTQSDQITCREFKNEQDLISSRFWKDLQKNKNKQMAKSTIILLKDTNTTYHFDESEWSEDQFEALNDHEFEITKRYREISLVEMSFGKLKPFERIVSLTGCMKMDKGTSSIFQTYSDVLYLALPPEISVRGAVFVLSATLSVGSYGLTLSYERDLTIRCKGSPGEPVQIFRKEKYALFPKAKLRKVKFKRRFKRGVWKKLYTSLKYKNLGVMFLDLSNGNKPYCEARPDKVQCRKIDSLGVLSGV